MRIHEQNFIKHLQAGKEEALDYVIDHYLPRLKGVVCKTLGSIQQQEMIGECLNDILLAIWKNAKKFKGDATAFEKWICVIAKYKAIDYYRTVTAKNESDISTLEYSLADQSQDFAQAFESEQQILDMLRELDSLDQKLFIMRYLLGFKTEEIAEQLQMTKSAIDNRIYRGKKKIKQQISKGGVLNEGHI
ncbi:sigma-70 family RNA polymerase sigma factor [Metasolibacillus meyeri]|uniref:sigma-70 family RNA polymerase sigma factor n=1 Tax=Metasolibacillus meyeri TaxID=1071052 RepID=UPI000D31F487|nr:sigma-70 family RNA polymerase sigma factor [Metasolibacillus meyeri]